MTNKFKHVWWIIVAEDGTIQEETFAKSVTKAWKKFTPHSLYRGPLIKHLKRVGYSAVKIIINPQVKK